MDMTVHLTPELCRVEGNTLWIGVPLGETRPETHEESVPVNDPGHLGRDGEWW